MLIFGFAACGGAQVADDGGSTATSDETAQAVQETEQEEVSGPFGKADMVFVHEGKSYPISSDAAPLLEVFGSDYEVITAPSCAFEGEDKQFIYDFAEVFTYPDGDTDLINEIYVFDGDFTTGRGISLGDTLEAVIEAYGEGGFEQGDTYVYPLSGSMEDAGSQRLTFELTDGKVSGISWFGANGLEL